MIENAHKFIGNLLVVNEYAYRITENPLIAYEDLAKAPSGVLSIVP